MLSVPSVTFLVPGLKVIDEMAEAFKRYALEKVEHAAKFTRLLGEVMWDTKTNVEKRMLAEKSTCAGKTENTIFVCFQIKMGKCVALSQEKRNFDVDSVREPSPGILKK